MKDTIHSIDTVVKVIKDTVMIIKDNGEIYTSAVSTMNLEVAVLAVLIAFFGIIIMVALAFFGVKWFRDHEKIKSLINERVEAMRRILQEDVESKLKTQKDDLERISQETLTESKKRDLLIWMRGIIVADKKDLFAIVQAMNMACELKDENTALVMCSEAVDYAKEHTLEVSRKGYWGFVGVERAIEKVMETFGKNEDAKTLISHYISSIEEIKSGKDGAAPARKD